jgi:hypothetical protein
MPRAAAATAELAQMSLEDGASTTFRVDSSTRRQAGTVEVERRDLQGANTGSGAMNPFVSV